MEFDLPPDYEQRKRKLLEIKGIDPLKFDLDLNTMSVVPRAEKPASELESFGTAAAYNLPEAASSVVGARVGNAAGAGIAGLASRIGPALMKGPLPAKIIGGLATLAGALTAPALTSKITNPVKESISPGITSRLETMRMDNPMSTALGAQASALPFFKISNPMKSGLPNVAAGIGLGAGIPIAQSLQEDSDISVQDVIAGAAGGAFMSNPTRLGSKLLGSRGVGTPIIPDSTKPPVDRAEFNPVDTMESEGGIPGILPRAQLRSRLPTPPELMADSGGQVRMDNFRSAPNYVDRESSVRVPKEPSKVLTKDERLTAEDAILSERAKEQRVLDEIEMRAAKAQAEQSEVPLTDDLAKELQDSLQQRQVRSPKQAKNQNLLENEPGVRRGSLMANETGPEPTINIGEQDPEFLRWKENNRRRAEEVKPGLDSGSVESLSEYREADAPKAPEDTPLTHAGREATADYANQNPETRYSGIPIPETIEAIKEQIAATIHTRSSKKATLITPGSKAPPLPPELRRTETPHGIVYWNPRKTTKEEVMQAGSGKVFDGRLLGMSSPNEAVRGNELVTTSTDNAENVLSELLPAGKSPDEAIAAQQEAIPGGRTEVKSDTQVAEERQQPEVRNFGPLKPKIQSQFGPQQEPEIKSRTGWNIFRAPTAKLRSLGGQHAEFADASELVFNKHRELTGRYANPMIKAFEDLNPREQQNLYQVLIQEDRTGSSGAASLTPKEKKSYDIVRSILDLMAKDQIAAGQMVKLSNNIRRTRGNDPFYAMNVMDHGVRRILSEGQGTKQYNDLKKDFIDWQVQRNITPDEAEARFTKLQGSFSRAAEGNEFAFKATRLPEGVGLPDSWIERDPIQAVRSYVNKFTRDRAFYDVIEKDPRMMKMLGSDKFGNGQQIPPTIQVENLSRDPHVKQILSSFAGLDSPHNEPVVAGLGRVVNAAILSGPPTRLTDLASVPIKALAYVPPGHETVIAKGIAQWRKGWKDSFDKGLNRRGGLMVAQDILGIGEKASSTLGQIAEGITKITGSEHIEMLSRSLAQATGNLIAEAHLGLAKNGNTDSIKFLEKLGSDWKTADPIELGTRVAQLMQGKYNITNLPKLITDSPIAPFFGMMKWSVEQANNFERFVIEPALKDNNFAPFIRTIVGGLGGGLLLNEMREELSGKKPYTATWSELKAGKDAPGYKDALTYKMIGAAQVTGTAGIWMEILRQGYEELTGRMPQGFRYPVFEVGKDVKQRFGAAINAVREGENTGKVVTELTKDLLTRHVQMARVIRNQLGKGGKWEEAKKDIDKSNMMRDEDVYNRMMDKPQAAKVQTPPSYSRLTEKEFDKTDDLNEAASKVSKLVERGVKRSQGDPATLRSEMRKLSTIDVRGMPSPDNDPIGFVKYYNWLRETQGPEKARQLTSEFMKRRALADVKRDMIPKVE